MFTGFSPESFDFLWGIRMNNNRDWFQAHKGDYVQYLYEPMKTLAQELFQPFMEKSGELLKVSRIYRDARLHPPVPYKESLWLCIRRVTDNWAQKPCLYLEINPEGVDYGFFFWKPGTASLEQFRRHITAYPEEFLQLIRSTEEAVGQPILADCYKRPKPAQNPELSPYFAWKGQIGCTRQIPPGESLFDPSFKAEVADFFEKLTPLYEYFNQF